MKRTNMKNDDETRRKAGRPLTTVSPPVDLVSSWCHTEKKGKIRLGVLPADESSLVINDSYVHVFMHANLNKYEIPRSFLFKKAVSENFLSRRFSGVSWRFSAVFRGFCGF